MGFKTGPYIKTSKGFEFYHYTTTFEEDTTGPHKWALSVCFHPCRFRNRTSLFFPRNLLTLSRQISRKKHPHHQVLLLPLPHWSFSLYEKVVIFRSNWDSTLVFPMFWCSVVNSKHSLCIKFLSFSAD